MQEPESSPDGCTDARLSQIKVMVARAGKPARIMDDGADHRNTVKRGRNGDLEPLPGLIGHAIACARLGGDVVVAVGALPRVGHAV